MKPRLYLTLLPMAATLSTAIATDYITGGGNPVDPLSWSPDATAIINAGTSTITPAAGDSLRYNGGIDGGNIVINAGAALVQTGAGQLRMGSHLDLAGTGTDGLGAFRNLGTDWANVSDVRVAEDATINLETGGWRHDFHGGAMNQLDMNGKNLTVTGSTGASNMYFVNTTLVGTGTITINNLGGEANFEGVSVLPEDISLTLNATRSSSWDGAGKVHEGAVTLNGGSTLETRYNDAGKTWNGSLTLGDGNQFLRTSDSGAGGGSIIINGQITGDGRLVKDGGMVGGTATITNSTNDFTGGVEVRTGILSVGTTGAVPTGSDVVVNNGATLDLQANNVNMGSGNINGTVSGSGTATLIMSGSGTKTIAAATTASGTGASITAPGGVELAGGVVKTNGLDVITGPVSVTASTTLQPQPQTSVSQSGLKEYRRSGSDLNADAGTTGATFMGIQTGIPAIDSTAKPFGDNNAFIYSGELVNTTAAPITVTFGEQYDDQIRVKVDGSTVLFDTGWNTPTASAGITLTPGAHTVEFSSFDGSGGAGPNSGWDKGIGILVGTYAITDLNGGTDSAAFSAITAATLPAGLTFGTFSETFGTNTDSKNISILAGNTLTVNTADMGGATYTMTGVLSGAGNVAKTGAGTMVLTGVSTYTGTTTVEAGTLALSPTGSLSPASVVTVMPGATFDVSAVAGYSIPSNQVLDGNGTVTGSLIVNGELSPGASIGTLTFLNDLTLAGTATFEISPAAAADLASVSGILTYGGTLDVLNIGGALTNGDTFNLFDAATFSGAFSTVNLPGGASMWINNLATNGTITYVPEPGVFSLSLLGAAALLRRRRRQA